MDVKLLIERAKKHCANRGVRLTAKRKLVFESLLSSGKALSAYEIIAFCQLHYGETILAMSVYRILEFLEQEHLVHKLHLANKYVVCSCIADDHHDISQFLICKSCYKVKEVKINKDTLVQLQYNIEQVGFKLITPQLEMHCMCNECNILNS